MSHEKIQIDKKKSKLDGLTFENLQVKCENDRIKNLNFVTDEDLKIFHDMYVKLNKLNKMQNSDEIAYYITENDLNKICNEKIQQICITTEKTHHKSQSKKFDKYDQINDTKNIITFDNVELESILAKLNDDGNFNLLNDKNKYYDVNDVNEYDIFMISNDDKLISYHGMPKNSFDSFMLVSKNFVGKTLNYDLTDGRNALFLIYSKMWPNYTYPIYVIIRDYKISTEKFIMIIDVILNLVTK